MRYSAALVATQRFCFSSVEVPTTRPSWMPSVDPYVVLPRGHGLGPAKDPPSAGPASAGPASAGPASGPASGGPASGGPASGGPASGWPESGVPASGPTFPPPPSCALLHPRHSASANAQVPTIIARRLPPRSHAGAPLLCESRANARPQASDLRRLASDLGAADSGLQIPPEARGPMRTLLPQRRTAFPIDRRVWYSSIP